MGIINFFGRMGIIHFFRAVLQTHNDIVSGLPAGIVLCFTSLYQLWRKKNEIITSIELN